MNPMTEFKFHTTAVRVFPTEDGQSFWVVAKDVAEVLGYRDAANLTRQVPDHQKGTRLVSTPGGDQSVLVISEGGLYWAALRSEKPEAEPFMDWVTDDVLPSIRKTGAYAYIKPGSESVSFAAVQLAMAQELGKLSDQINHLTAEVIGAQRGEMRATQRLMTLQKRQAAHEAVETILRMEAAGRPRAEISQITGKNSNHVRQVIYQARRDGLLPTKPEAADQVEPQMDFEFSLS
jgi:prophage antirepressor-like protein